MHVAAEFPSNLHFYTRCTVFVGPLFFYSFFLLKIVGLSAASLRTNGLVIIQGSCYLLFTKDYIDRDLVILFERCSTRNGAKVDLPEGSPEEKKTKKAEKALKTKRVNQLQSSKCV